MGSGEKEPAGDSLEVRVEQPKPGGRTGRIKLGVAEMELPPWALTFAALLVVCALAGYLYSLVAPLIAGRQLVALDLVKQFEEYQKHVMEAPGARALVFQDPARGWLEAKLFDSDGCIELTGKTPAGGVERFIQAAEIRIPAPGNTNGGRRAGAAASGSDASFPAAYPQSDLPAPSTLLVAMSDAERTELNPVRIPTQAPNCSGRCLNPHPGAFTSWNGDRNGCWVQVWRQWPEGCKHYQWYNSCNGFWDADQNGPKIYWVCCIPH